MKRSRTVVLTVLTLFVGLGLAWTRLGAYTEERRSARMEELAPSPTLQHHQTIARRLRDRDASQSRVSLDDGDCPDELTRARAYRALLEEARACLAAETWRKYESSEAPGRLAWAAYGNDWGPDPSHDELEAMEPLENEAVEACGAVIAKARSLLPCGGPLYTVDLKDAASLSYKRDTHYDTVVGMSFLLEADARAAARLGDRERALADVAALFHGCAVMADLPLVVESVDFADWWGGAAEHALYQVSHWDTLSAHECDILLEALAALEPEPDLAGAVASECYFQLCRSQAWREASLGDCVKVYGVYALGDYMWNSSICAPAHNRDDMAMMNLFGDIQEALTLPQPERMMRIRAIAEKGENLSSLYRWTRHWARGLPEILQDSQDLRKRLQLMRIGLTVERQHAIHEVYPRALTDMVDGEGRALISDNEAKYWEYVPFETFFVLHGPTLRNDDGTRTIKFVWRGHNMTEEQVKDHVARGSSENGTATVHVEFGRIRVTIEPSSSSPSSPLP